MKIIRYILNSRLVGYVIGGIGAILFGVSHILTLEEAETFSNSPQKK
ncbi:hypothetical protein [Xenorhabdus sp. KK7.4]|nr:hypothetical protein [Xenorhabdus sp. KK7.4]PHM54365.1 hypothetical protein Xekk_02561 [Xenorhabdus sp. KK7.4]